MIRMNYVLNVPNQIWLINVFNWANIMSLIMPKVFD